MPTNFENFNKRVRIKTKLFARTIPLAHIHAIAFDALGRVVLKTPVDTGRARGGWQINLNEVGTGAGPKSKSGDRVLSAGLARINRAGLDDTIYITNSVPYIRDLERGSSSQAPSGMVRLTLVEMKGVLK